jgi:hypothetical protein
MPRSRLKHCWRNSPAFIPQAFSHFLKDDSDGLRIYAICLLLVNGKNADFNDMIDTTRMPWRSIVSSAASGDIA